MLLQMIPKGSHENSLKLETRAVTSPISSYSLSDLGCSRQESADKYPGGKCLCWWDANFHICPIMHSFPFKMNILFWFCLFFCKWKLLWTFPAFGLSEIQIHSIQTAVIFESGQISTPFILIHMASLAVSGWLFGVCLFITEAIWKALTS